MSNDGMGDFGVIALIKCKWRHCQLPNLYLLLRSQLRYRKGQPVPYYEAKQQLLDDL